MNKTGKDPILPNQLFLYPWLRPADGALTRLRESLNSHFEETVAKDTSFERKFGTREFNAPQLWQIQ